MPPSLDHEAMVDLTHADEHPGLDNRATRSRLSDFLMDGGVTASYFYGELAPE
jgi:hypothetical protein